MERSDPDLLARIACEDRAAFAELYARHASKVLGLALGIVRDPLLADEVVQDVFLSIWRQAARFDARRARPSTWLMAIAHHKAVDAVRRAERRRCEGAGGLASLPDTTDVPAEAWLGAQAEQLRDALACLSPTHREVIERCYFGGLSQLELARASGDPLGTVKSRTHAALAHLRVQLERRETTAELLYGSG
jgi:RNA polymerase sigma-70 factor (ECF subfamily)